MKRHLNTHNRDRQRLPGASSSSGAMNGTIRDSNHKIEAVDTEADVDAPESQDHNAMQNIHLHELENSTTITVVSLFYILKGTTTL